VSTAQFVVVVVLSSLGALFGIAGVVVAVLAMRRLP